MNRMLVKGSSNISSMGWEDGVLEVEFMNGKLYRYTDVDEETWRSMQEADSVGKFLAREIKPNCPCERIEDDRDSSNKA